MACHFASNGILVFETDGGIYRNMKLKPYYVIAQGQLSGEATQHAKDSNPALELDWNVIRKKLAWPLAVNND
jgi:hypothetical protein